MKKTISIVVRIIVSLGLIALFVVLILREIQPIRHAFLHNPLAVSWRVERDKVKAKAMMITLNHYRPDFNLWQEYLQSGKIPTTGFLKDNVRYYELLRSYVPQISEPHHMLAVCYDLLGDKVKAYEEQKKFVAKETHFFWGWYNLGVLAYKTEHFQEARAAFQQALSLRPDVALRILSSSRLYVEVIRGAQATNELNMLRVKRGYQEAYRLLNASVLRLEGRDVPIDDKEITPKIF